MYLALLEKYEKEVISGRIAPVRHDARFDFALWLEKNAAQQSVQRTGSHVCETVDPKTNRCIECGAVQE